MIVKKKDIVLCASVIAWLYIVLTLHGSEKFKFTDITATKKIRIHEFTKTSDSYTLFLKVNVTCVKKCGVVCDIL
jgi:hypothetical protein